MRVVMKKVKLKSYFLDRVLPRFVILLIDIIILIFSFLAVLLAYNSFPVINVLTQRSSLVLCSTLVFFNTLSFLLFRTYRGVLRFSSFRDLLRLTLSLLVGYIASFLVLAVSHSGVRTFQYPPLLFVAIFFVNLCLMILSRVVVKEGYELIIGQSKKMIKVFIYGTKSPGISLAKALKSSSELNYKLEGFVSDDPMMIGKSLMGFTVHAFNDQLFRTMRSKEVQTILVSPLKMEEVKYSEKLTQLVDNDIAILTTTPITEWKDGTNIGEEQIKEIEIEDLLPRLPIKLNMENVVNSIENKRIIVTGAAGSIGSEIVRQLAKLNPATLVLIDQAETPLHDLELELKSDYRELRFKTKVVDVCNHDRMECIFAKTRPHFLFHAAAYKHVPMMENNVPEAIQNNVLGTKIIADLAVKHGTEKFVMVSTDKAVNPSNVMGCSKRICEIYVQSLNRYVNAGANGTQFITTRFGNVLGSSGSVIPLFKEQIKRGGPVTVTHPEIIRYFMTIPEACQLVLEAGAMGEGGEIYIFDMGSPVKISELAKRMITLSGAKNVKIEYTGLRQGEKLYEELLNDKEHVQPTSHDKIMIANVREYDFEDVARQVDELIELSRTADDLRIVAKMKAIVPEFQSTNTLFEEINNEPLVDN